ncbi:MAG: UDP-N-acetylglucosamine--N-acetylmuramyl-(pentapeptide) pyrophosphoryl-undecaprenol N-acetylglucosamine transferase [Candidatus Omnitrophota bacterium]|nr:MAG: UDP-N-acetylglucosamine--N-acetylmuramyl-(pentapeptide) pyrophosphoryl-undecaprenol N-acetylglucosamine transferase [Candidatus Omnitrophota bacterium]
MRILIACGGTAGHIFPALALIEELKKEDKDSSVRIVISRHPRDREYLRRGVVSGDIQIKSISSAPLPYRFSLKCISFGLRLLWACIESFFIILRYRPQVIVGFGGHTSFAPLIVGRILDIPALIHEQNLVPGRANRFLGWISNRVAVTFEDTKKFFGKGDKAIKTGLPLRRQRKDCNSAPLDSFAADKEKLTILVLGGSQGAHNINELVLNCLSGMDRELRSRLRLIHLSGRRDFSYVKARYASMGVVSCVFDFLEDMPAAYRCADLLIGRAGASTIFEAAGFGLACLFIPYSHAGAHQKENALFLKRQGAALVWDEGALDKDFEKALLELMSRESLRRDLSQKIKSLEMPAAAGNLKEEVLTLYREAHVR